MGSLVTGCICWEIRLVSCQRDHVTSAPPCYRPVLHRAGYSLPHHSRTRRRRSHLGDVEGAQASPHKRKPLQVCYRCGISKCASGRIQATVLSGRSIARLGATHDLVLRPPSGMVGLGYGSGGGVMTNVPSSRNSSLPWFFTQGAGSSTIMDGKFCLLYLEGLSLRLGSFSSGVSVVCLEEMQQRLDKNPMAKPVLCVRCGRGAWREWHRLGRGRMERMGG